MTDNIQALINKAKSSPKHIVLAEGEDIRILEASARATRNGIAKITLIGREDKIREQGIKSNISLEDMIIVDPYSEEQRLFLAAQDATSQTLSNPDLLPLHLANILVSKGRADGSLAGAVFTSSDVINSALNFIGTTDDDITPSSFFIMGLHADHHPVEGDIIFADCALNIKPSAKQLAQIAIDSARNAELFLNLDPKIAMLSFLTKPGNLDGKDKVSRAIKIANSIAPTLEIEGPLQFDAAIMPSVAAIKAPEATVAGQANVFIFPDLNSGNIAYKIAQRIGGAQALGPILQGFKRPANDLSRGANVDDIYNMIVITVVQAQAQSPS